MDSTKLVSVIIPTKNSARTLEKCLNSVKNQSYKDVELIVVDNNSTDNTKEIAKKYTNKVYNCGPERSAQRNFGAKKSKGDLIYFVDSDFVLQREVIEKCVEKISENFDAIVVHNTPDSHVSWIAWIRKFEVDMYKYDLTHSAARFFKKGVFETVGGYNPKITAAEDYDIQNRLNRNKYKTGFVEPEAIHLGEPKYFIKHMMKYYEYGKDMINFKKYNKKESKRQLKFFRHVYFKKWKNFLFHPLKTIIFCFYNICKYTFGSLGYVVGFLEKKENEKK